MGKISCIYCPESRYVATGKDENGMVKGHTICTRNGQHTIFLFECPKKKVAKK